VAGKTSLMVKYVENRFDEDYLQTIGVSYMEKTVSAGLFILHTLESFLNSEKLQVLSTLFSVYGI
jgi:GTPase SAR1 family protein